MTGLHGLDRFGECKARLAILPGLGRGVVIELDQRGVHQALQALDYIKSNFTNAVSADMLGFGVGAEAGDAVIERRHARLQRKGACAGV